MTDINLEVTRDEINSGVKKASALNGTAAEINKILANVANKQDTLVSGTNIKTINNQTLLGSGNITIQGGSGSVDIDNKTITKNESNEIQAISTIDSCDNSTALKYWTGTRSQYNAITTKDDNTLYNITDDTIIASIGADTDLSNITDAGKILISNLGKPSNVYETLADPDTGATRVTAPANGWYAYQKNATASGQILGINNATAGMYTLIRTVGSGDYSVFMPAAKGDNIDLINFMNGTTVNVRFIYDLGSVSEAE